MPETVTDLVDVVLDEGGFEADRGTVLRWLNNRHRSMCARSLCYRKTATVGSTVIGQADYVVPAGLIAAFLIDLDGVPYVHLSPTDIAQGVRGYLQLSGDAAGFGSVAGASGANLLRLFPTPTEAGKSIHVYGAFMPDDLAFGGTLIPDADFYDALVDGAIATGLSREGREDMGAAKEQMFQRGCEELRIRVKERLNTKGPAQIRLAGFGY